MNSKPRFSLKANKLIYYLGGGVLGILTSVSISNLTYQDSKENLKFTNQNIIQKPIFIDSEIVKFEEKTISIDQGYTLVRLLKENAVKRQDLAKVTNALSRKYDLRKIKAGQTISIRNKRSAKNLVLDSIKINIRPHQDLIAYRSDNTGFTAKLVNKSIIKSVVAISGKIDKSLYSSAFNQQTPPEILINMINLFSYDVDFQRDIRKQDNFEIMFEHIHTKSGAVVKNGPIKYASLNLRGKIIKVYSFIDSEGKVFYYDSNGHSINKALLKTPVQGARLSSYFGRRRHPILGYNTIHRGIDFAAPAGTPVYAAGDGLIVKRENWGGYGNYIQIKHKNGFSTAYAHLKKFKKNHRVGNRVKQGTIIGYVGSTGQSTGPHLHYEVLKNGKQINPMQIKMPASKKLSGKELNAFKISKKTIEREWTALTNSSEIAFSMNKQPVKLIK